MASETPFDPTRHLTRVSGSDYLEVKWRLVWLRDRHPDATLETELVSHHDNTAIFRAQVQIPGGGASLLVNSRGWAIVAISLICSVRVSSDRKALLTRDVPLTRPALPRWTATE